MKSEIYGSFRKISKAITLLMLIILSSMFAISMGRSASFYKIDIDGNNDWSSGLIIMNDPPNDNTAGNPLFEIYNVYANVSDTFLYLGIEVNSNVGDLFVAISYKESSSEEIQDMVWSKNVEFLPWVRPELIIVLDDEAAQAWDRFSGSVARNGTIESQMQAAITTNFREVKIRLEDLRNSPWINLSVFVTATEDWKAVIDIAPNDPNVNTTGNIWDDRDFISTMYNLSLTGTSRISERSITLDGNLGDFRQDEIIAKDLIADTSNDGGDIWNVSTAKNSTHIFFGINGPILNDAGSIRQHTMFIALDTGSGGGAALPWNRNVLFSPGDTRPNFVVCLGRQNTVDPLIAHLYEVNASFEFEYKEDVELNFLAFGTNYTTEVGIPLSSIGNPTQFNFSVIVTGRNEFMSAIDVFPNDNGLNKWYDDTDTLSNYTTFVSGAPNDIICDGNLADWVISDYYISEMGDTIAYNADLDTLFCTWTQDYVYLALNGTDPRNVVPYLVDLFIAIDFREGGGTTNFWAKNINFQAPFLPDLIIAVEDQTVYQILNWTGTAWADVKASFTNFGMSIGFNSEFRVSKIDLPANAMNISVFVTGDGDSTSAFDVIPNQQGVKPTHLDADVISQYVTVNGLNELDWHPDDPLPPTIIGPADITIEQFISTNIVWQITEEKPHTVIVYVNNVPNVVAFSINLSYSIDTSTIGVFNYTLWVNDSNGRVATDEVMVTVTAAVSPAIIVQSINATTSKLSLNSTTLQAGSQFLNKEDVIIKVMITEFVGFDTVLLNYSISDPQTNYSIAMTTLDSGSTRMFSAIIPGAQIDDRNTVSFLIWANDTQGLSTLADNSGEFFKFRIDGSPPNFTNYSPTLNLKFHDLHVFGWIFQDKVAARYQIISNITGTPLIVRSWQYFVNNSATVYSFKATIIGTVNLTIQLEDDFGYSDQKTLLITIGLPDEHYLPNQGSIVISETLNITNIVVNTPFNLSVNENPQILTPYSGSGVLRYYKFDLGLKNASETFSSIINIVLNQSVLDKYESGQFKVYYYDSQSQTWKEINIQTTGNVISFALNHSLTIALVGTIKQDQSSQPPSDQDVLRYIMYGGIGILAIGSFLYLMTRSKTPKPNTRSAGGKITQSTPKPPTDPKNELDQIEKVLDDNDKQ